MELSIIQKKIHTLIIMSLFLGFIPTSGIQIHFTHMAMGRNFHFCAPHTKIWVRSGVLVLRRGEQSDWNGVSCQKGKTSFLGYVQGEDITILKLTMSHQTSFRGFRKIKILKKSHKNTRQKRTTKVNLKNLKIWANARRVVATGWTREREGKLCPQVD